MTIERFVVDAKLLRELGERLVGRPHIALAELIKNSYDADARKVEVRFTGDTIEVIDDGHGMSREDFVDKWMRIGTVHKERRRYTPELRRPYTGSKGVGRLSAQVLARAMAIDSVGLRNEALAGIERRRSARRSQLHDQVRASVDWDDAIDKDTLNEVDVDVATSEPDTRFSEGSACGTWITLERLVTRWDAVQFRRVAQEIWALRPPFPLPEGDERTFEISLVSEHGDVVAEFERQMGAILDIWIGRVTAELLDEPPSEAETFTLTGDMDAADDSADERGTGADTTEVSDQGETAEHELVAHDTPFGHASYPTRWLRVAVRLRGQRPNVYVVRVPGCRLADVSYEIRIFDLIDRQPKNVKVGDAREYLRNYGGVSVFDQGFRLPYYGADLDWLKIERDHANRLSRSKILPSSLHVDRALNDLPTNRRIFGSVYVSTAREAERSAEGGQSSRDALTIQVTRDRLVENASYEQLKNIVRIGTDLYARDVARRRASQALARRSTARPSERFRKVQDQIEDIRDRLPASTFASLRSTVDTAVRDAEAIERSTQAHTTLLAALATTGMMSLAYDHDASKQIHEVLASARRLRRIATNLADASSADKLQLEAKHLQEWANRANKLRMMFRSMADEESRQQTDTFNARRLVQDVVQGVAVLRGRTTVECAGIPADLTLPRAAYVAWTAIFQNLLVNAFNATLDLESTTPPRVDIDGGSDGHTSWIRLQDTGVGVDLDDAEELFQPFVRGQAIDRRRAALGLGGSGLGLAIVRMIAADIKIRVGFEPPDDSHSTSIVLRWGSIDRLRPV